MAGQAPGSVTATARRGSSAGPTSGHAIERAVSLAYAVGAVVLLATVGWRLPVEVWRALAAWVGGSGPGLDGEPVFYVLFFGVLLAAQICLCLVAWWLWRGRRRGRRLALMLLAGWSLVLLFGWAWAEPELTVPWVAQVVAVTLLWRSRSGGRSRARAV